MLKAIFPQGVTELTVNGLHQWDYGQQLEIVATDLPAMVEVHFACVGMQSAEVRTCSAVSGRFTVSIPDLCLEQIAPIVAWIFAINGNEGTTVKTITLPIIPRVKPQIESSIPRDNTDAYTQFLTEVNKAVGALKDGDVTARRALNADNADNAVHSNETDAVLSGDTSDTAGHLDNLTTPGRYYCKYDTGTPTGGDGYVDVFRRFSNTMQVFYSWTSGDVYLRKTSKPEETNKQWSDWRKGGADSLYIESARMDSPSQAGLYLIERRASNGVLYSEILFITDLTRNAMSCKEDGAYYDAVDKKIMTNDGTLSNVILIGPYAGGSVG